MGAFYMGRDPTERGNVIRYNYWHDLAPGHMTFCLYFDDHTGDGTTVTGNVFHKAGNAATILANASREMTFSNNLFVDCSTQAIVVSIEFNWVKGGHVFRVSGWEPPGGHQHKARHSDGPQFTTFLRKSG